MRIKLMLSAITLCLLLVACGQKGELVRPESKPEAQAAP